MIDRHIGEIRPGEKPVKPRGTRGGPIRGPKTQKSPKNQSGNRPSASRMGETKQTGNGVMGGVLKKLNRLSHTKTPGCQVLTWVLFQALRSGRRPVNKKRQQKIKGGSPVPRSKSAIANGRRKKTRDNQFAYWAGMNPKFVSPSGRKTSSTGSIREIEARTRINQGWAPGPAQRGNAQKLTAWAGSC